MAKITKYITLVTTEFTTVNSTYTIASAYEDSKFYYDSSLYDSITGVYLEGSIKSSSAARTTTVAIHTDAGTLVAGSDISTTSTTYVQIRSADCSANIASGINRLYIKLSGSGTAYVKGSRIVIVQNGNITKTASYYLLNSTYNFTNATSYVDFTNGTRNYNNQYKYNSANFDGTITAKLDVLIHNSTVSKTVYIKLYDSADNAISSEISTTSTVPVHIESSDFTPVNNTIYKCKTKNTTAGYSIYTSAYIRITQTNTPTKTESYLQFGTNETTSTTYTTTALLPYTIQSTDFDTTNTYYYCGAIEIGNAGATGYAQLSNVASSEISSTSTTATYQSIGSLSMPANGTAIDCQVKTSNATYTAKAEFSCLTIACVMGGGVQAVIPYRTLLGIGT